MGPDQEVPMSAVTPLALTLPPPPPVEEDDALPGPWLDDPAYAVADFLRGLAPQRSTPPGPNDEKRCAR